MPVHLSPGSRLLWIAVPIVVALGILAAVLAIDGTSARQRASEDALAVVATSASSALDRFVTSRLEQLTAMAASAQVAGPADAAAAYLTALTTPDGPFLNYGLTGPDGYLQVVSGAVQPTERTYLGDRDFVQAVLQTGQPFVGRAVLGRVTASPTVPFAVPVLRDGHVRAVLSGGVLASTLERVLDDLRLQTQVSLHLVDRANQVIAGDQPLSDVGSDPTFQALSGRLSEVLKGLAPINGDGPAVVAIAQRSSSGWLVVADEPLAVAFGGADATLAAELIADAALVLVSVAALAWVARRLDALDRARRATAEAADEARTIAEVARLESEAHRRDAESAQAQQTFLADASRVLAEPLDPMATLEAFVNLAIPRLADFCAIDLFGPDGTFSEARIASPDPAKVALAHELRAAYPYRRDATMGVAAVFATGIPEHLLAIPEGFFSWIPDDRLRGIMEGLGFRGYISVPMSVPDGRRLGVLTVVMAESGRAFSERDVQTVIDLGRRTGVALDHAALFEEVAARRDEMEAVIGAIDDPVLVASPVGRIVSANPAAVRMFERTVGCGLGDALASLDSVPARPDVLYAARTATYVRPHLIEAARQGSSMQIAVLRDVTSLLETEAARDAFIGMLSHELRTPVTTIIGMTDVLRRPQAAPDAEILDDLGAEADRLYRLIEDLLVLSRFERGRLEVDMEPVLVQHVVNGALNRLRALHPGLHVEVHTEPDMPPALADATYLEQITRNLASNAVKYAGEAAHVIVRASQHAGSVVIEFEDDGPGIPDGDGERVFELYERLARTASKPGAGIGLFVCRRLMEAMGGQITVRPGQAGGACFRFWLPAVEEDGRSAQPAPNARATLVGIHQAPPLAM